MRIAVISDLHLGYGSGSEKEEDCFRQAEEAFKTAINEKPDLILLAGDLFDSRIPRQEVYARALRLFQLPLLAEKSQARLVKIIERSEHISPIAFSGIPVIVIHGTHERRGAHAVNPVQILENAGFLIHLHCSGVIFEKNGELVCIKGFSGVPEQYAKKILHEWNPKPEKGCRNIFMLHQSLTEYIYSEEENAFLSIADLPKGFDVYIAGHIHWSGVNGNIFFPGSTIITQQKKFEMEKRKGFYIIDLNEKIDYKYFELKTQRPFYYEEFCFENAGIEEVIKKVREKIRGILEKDEKKPAIMVKLIGTLEKGKEASNIYDEDIRKDFNAIITVRNELESEGFRKKIEHLREIQQKKLSVEEIGLDLIERLLKQTKYKGIPPSQVIDLLSEGKTDLVIKRVLSKFEETK